VRALELKVPPGALVAIIAAGMWAVSRISPNLYFPIPGVAWLSAGIAVLGVSISILGVLEFIVAGTSIDPRRPERSVNLVVSGVYGHSRNPMYLGLLLVLCAWGLFLGSVPSLLLLPAFVTYMTRFQVVPEERFMHKKFGESYSKYTFEVRRVMIGPCPKRKNHSTMENCNELTSWFFCGFGVVFFLCSLFLFRVGLGSAR
jgi:protein-S-isoprenylcysteine O-methyltransferase Ste14